MIVSALVALFLAVASTDPVQPPAPSFIDAAEAYEAGDFALCANGLLSLEAGGRSWPSNGELLAAECLARAGRTGEAVAFVRRQLPNARISIQDLRSKSRPGLDAMRNDPGWTALLAEAECVQALMDTPLREELLMRLERDQQERNAIKGKPDASIDAARRASFADVDSDNLTWIKGVVVLCGWPGNRLVGPDGAHAAWLLAQHADADPDFQRKVLALMKLAPRDVDQADIAYLTDRVLQAEGLPQRYGTQFKTSEDGVARMGPVEDAPNLEVRRASMGLSPIAEYRQLIKQQSGGPVE